MKQYVVDQLLPQDYEKLRSHFEDRYGHPQLDTIFWVPLDPGAFTPLQRRHLGCQPFFLAVDLQPDRLVCELLVRTKKKMRCGCMGYATASQRDWFMQVIDDILDRLNIKV